jgi:hypothetical protein
MKDKSIGALLKKAQTKRPFINQGKFHLRNYVNPPISKNEYGRRPRLNIKSRELL